MDERDSGAAATGSQQLTVGGISFDNVCYDEEADVLYLHVGDPATATDFDESPEGHALRFDATGKLVGVTLVRPRDSVRRGDGVTLTLPGQEPVTVAAATLESVLPSRLHGITQASRLYAASDGDPSAEQDIESNFGMNRLTYLPQRKRAVPPQVTATLQQRLPLVADFRILLRPHQDGYLAPEFWSARRGFLVHAFPWRDALAQEFHSSEEALFGIGDASSPLIDVEMGQELFLWRQGDELVILAGDPDAEPGSFRVAIRVPEAAFAEEWWNFVRAVRRYIGPEAGGSPELRHVFDDDGDVDIDDSTSGQV